MTSESELKVFITHRDATCGECGEDLGSKAWIMLAGEQALCLACADLEHLAFLPAGDAAVTRRAKKHSRLSAVVLRWSRSRKRYERQGLLVEEEALARAEAECLADEESRRRARERNAIRLQELDQQYVAQFAERIRQQFPHCPPAREQAIAEHACLKYSGRIGRTADAKTFSDDAIHLAVAAHVRHVETDYDDRLGRGHDRADARREVWDAVEQVLRSWSGLEFKL